MRIRLERQCPILRVQHVEEHDDNPDGALVMLVAPDIEVLRGWTIAVEVQHTGMPATRLRDLALDMMNRMIAITEPVANAPKLVGNPEAVPVDEDTP